MEIELQPELAKPKLQGLTTKTLLASAALVLVLAYGAFQFSTPGSDTLSAAETQAVATAFDAALPISLPTVLETEKQQAVASMALAPEDERALMSDSVAGVIDLRWFIVADWLAEDGDVVEISSGGFTQSVVMTNAGERIAVPVVDNRISLRGIADPGGGVTVAILTSSGESLPVPPLLSGETVEVSVR